MSASLTVTYGMAARVYWSYFWRTILLGLASGIIIAVLDFVIPKQLSPVLDILNLLIMLVVGFVVVGIVYRKRYPFYSVMMIDAAMNTERPVQWQDTLRVWWSICWRSGLFLMIPIFFGLGIGGVLVGQDLIKAAELRSCKHQLEIYQQNYQNPQMTAVIQQATDKYNKMNCAKRLANPTGEGTEEERDPATSGMAAIGVLLTLILFLLYIPIRIKIFQIVLRKQYQQFYMQVVSTQQMVGA